MAVSVAMNAEDLVRWAIAILGGAFLAWVLWISVQSLRQARLLKRLATGDLAGHLNRPYAIHGAVRVFAAARLAGRGEVLWCRETYQERRGWGKNRHWRTISDEWKMAAFAVQHAGEEIQVVGNPSEIHGTQSESDTDYAGFLSFDNDSRQILKWLPIPQRITVVGRLTGAPGRFKIERDGHHGLLLSPDSPEKTASRETLKGWAGLIVVIAGAAGLAWVIGH